MSSPHRLYRTDRMVSLTFKDAELLLHGGRRTYLAPPVYEHLGDYEILEALHRSPVVSVAIWRSPTTASISRMFSPLLYCRSI